MTFDEPLEGEEEVILETDDAWVVSCERGLKDEKLSRLMIYSTRELPEVRFTAEEVDALILSLMIMRRRDRLESIKLTTVDML